MKKTKSVVLLSGGLDSTVNLYAAHNEHEVALALTVDYGQRAAQKELESSARICAELNIPHKIIELPFFRDFTSSSLLNSEVDVPVGDDVEIDNLQVSEKTAEAVWVPNRNGLLLNLAAAYAEGLGAQYIVPGFNLEEAATFADNSQDFLQALTHSLSFSTANQVQAHCFTTNMNKTEIVKLGRQLNVNFDLIWSCYFANDERCGVCESCQRFSRALEVANEI